MSDTRTVLEIATGVPKPGRSVQETAREKLRPTEHVEQSFLIQQLALKVGKYPELKLVYAVPNGGFRSKAEAGRFKAEGVRKSVPDLCLPSARGPFHSLYVEMKRVGEYGTPDQRAFARHLRAQGMAVFECQGHEEGFPIFERYLALEPFDVLRWDAGGRNSLDELRKLREHYHQLWAPRPIEQLWPDVAA